MKALRKIISAAAALCLALALSPSAHAAAQTYIDNTESASGGNTAALIAALAVVLLTFACLGVVVRLGKTGHMSVFWGAVAVFFSSLALLLAIVGCNTGALYARADGDPSETVSRFYDSVIAGDYETAYSCLEDYTSLGLETAPDTENAVAVYDALKASFEYTLSGSADIDKLSATQKVRFKYLNLDSLEASVADGVERKLEEIVESSPIDEVYDENNNYLPAVTERAYSEALASVLSHANSYYTAEEIEIELEYSGGQWLIVTNQAMLNALMGGAAY